MSFIYENIKKIIMHIDVNNAFLSWTAVKLLNNGHKLDIRKIPSVIAGDPKKRMGIILAKSPEAKKYGIVTGETLFSARKKCPNLQVYKGNYKLYLYMSNHFINIIKSYTPDIEQASIDECFIDYTSVKKMYGDELEFAKKLQKEIYNKLKFTVNIGIGNNKLCAKMASDFSKPNKIHTLYNDEIKAKMWPLDVGSLFGIGKKSEEVLKRININTIEDLAKSNINTLYKYFKNQAKSMIEWANGIDESIVDNSEYIPKGIGNELTLEHDIYEIEELHKYLLSLSDSVGIRIRKLGKYAHTIVVTIKDNEFRRKTHQKRLVNATDNTDEIYELSKKILNEMDISGVRLIGIRLDDLIDNTNHQLSIFDNISKKNSNKELDKTIDKLKNKYGNEVIRKASINQKREFKT